jgi:cell wall-associated NlpC family hydrolase
MKLVKRLSTALIIVMLSGCMNNVGGTKDLKQQSGPVKMQLEGQSPDELTEGRHIVPIQTIQNTAYVSLDDLTKATGYHGAWLRNGKYGVGDYDAAWTFSTGETAVMLAGRSLTMPAAAVKEGEQLHIPVSGLKQLFGDVTVFAIESDNVAFFPKPSPKETGVDGTNLNFADDTPVKPAMVAASGAKDTKEMLTFAKTFLGIKYDFGAEPYKREGTFDCSSFTQYVFDKYGVELPRVARQQAEDGQYIARDKLKMGDLLFFYVPGRFKSNEMVGHVGIYMGNGDMIHSSPKPEDGVQITPINKPYWKDTFLYAKRFL